MPAQVYQQIQNHSTKLGGVREQDAEMRAMRDATTLAAILADELSAPGIGLDDAVVSRERFEGAGLHSPQLPVATAHAAQPPYPPARATMFCFPPLLLPLPGGGSRGAGHVCHAGPGGQPDCELLPKTRRRWWPQWRGKRGGRGRTASCARRPRAGSHADRVLWRHADGRRGARCGLSPV